MNSVEKDNMLRQISVLQKQVLSLSGELQKIIKSYSDNTKTSLEKAIFETDHISWTIPEAKVVPLVEIKTPKSSTSSNKMHGKSVKNVTISPDCETKTSPS